MILKSMVAIVALLFALPLLAWAAGGEAFTDPATAGPDFAIQGEYLTSDGGQTWGGQIIALGEGKFDIVGYKGGLPGEGWQRGDERKKGTGQLVDGVATFTGDDWKATLRDGVLTVTDTAGNTLHTLKKVERKSPTLGAAPPTGAIVLFDGSTPDNFVGGVLAEDKYLAATGCESKQKFNDHKLHVEFRTPFMPKSRGQARGNSGVYIQSRYECQVLDSFGLEGENNECGGIYQQSKPAVNMCYPPLSWQTYDIDFTAARYDDAGNKTKNAVVTIKHNGVTIYDNLELKGGTPGRHKEGPGPDGLFLQNHGNPVVFRNIWVVEK